VQLYRCFVSQSSEFCRHNTLCCFSKSVYCCCCLFRYDSVRKLSDTVTPWGRILMYRRTLLLPSSARSSETSVSYHDTTRHYNPQDGKTQVSHLENMKHRIRWNSKLWTEGHLEGSGRGLFEYNIMECASKDWSSSRNANYDSLHPEYISNTGLRS
jgi:hypothetical protein